MIWWNFVSSGNRLMSILQPKSMSCIVGRASSVGLWKQKLKITFPATLRNTFSTFFFNQSSYKCMRRKLSGFISPWMILHLCRYSTIWSISMVKKIAKHSTNGFPVAIFTWFVTAKSVPYFENWETSTLPLSVTYAFVISMNPRNWNDKWFLQRSVSTTNNFFLQGYQYFVI